MADSAADVARKVARALEEMQDARLSARMNQAVMQLLRFTQTNIEVDTGRTKNSLVGTVTQASGRGITGMVASSNVSYAPYVREAGHTVHFVDFAYEREVPRILDWLVEDVISEVTRIIES